MEELKQDYLQREGQHKRYQIIPYEESCGLVDDCHWRRIDRDFGLLQHGECLQVGRRTAKEEIRHVG